MDKISIDNRKLLKYSYLQK